MKNIFLTTCYIFLAFFGVQAQEIKYSDNLSELLKQTKVDVFLPTESDYRDVNILKRATAYQPYQLALRSRKEKLEIRYAIQPIDTIQQFYFPPNANFMRTITHLASNEEEHVIAVHSMASNDLEEIFNADWGKEALFTPKDIFSERNHCKMLMLHKDGVGDVFVFFLFDLPNEDLDTRYYALQFLEEEIKEEKKD